MTIQVNDRIHWNGNYHDDYCKMPNFNGISITSDSRFEMDTKNTPSFIRGTACNRGYQAEWEIKDNNLYLIELNSDYKMKSPEIFCDWFTGYVRLNIKSDEKTYVNEFFIQSGRVIKHEALTLKDSFDRDQAISNASWSASCKINEEEKAKEREEANERLGKKVMIYLVGITVVAIYIFTT